VFPDRGGPVGYDSLRFVRRTDFAGTVVIDVIAVPPRRFGGPEKLGSSGRTPSAHDAVRRSGAYATTTYA
jgi:hypothetical protein